MALDWVARIEASRVGDAESRESATLRDAEAGVRIDERTTVQASAIAGPTDVNATASVETRRSSRRSGQPQRGRRGLRPRTGRPGMSFRVNVLVEVVSSAARSSARAPSSCGVAVGEQAVVGTGVTVTGDVPAGAVADKK